MVGGGFQPCFGSMSNFFFVKEKKISFHPKAQHASIQPKVDFFCSLLNMLPLRSYIKIYFLSAGDKLKPEKLPCNFSTLILLLAKGTSSPPVATGSCSLGRELTVVLPPIGAGRSSWPSFITGPSPTSPHCTALTQHQSTELGEHVGCAS